VPVLPVMVVVMAIVLPLAIARTAEAVVIATLGVSG
jgi:hypothetical protein